MFRAEMTQEDQDIQAGVLMNMARKGVLCGPRAMRDVVLPGFATALRGVGYAAKRDAEIMCCETATGKHFSAYANHAARAFYGTNITGTNFGLNTFRPKRRHACPKCDWQGLRARVRKCPRCGFWHPSPVKEQS